MSEPPRTGTEAGYLEVPGEGNPKSAQPMEQSKPNWFWPLVCFVATCVSSWFVGAVHWRPMEYIGNWVALWPMVEFYWSSGLLYMAALMGILGMHELGHFWASRRHRIPASYPYFLPVPVVPFGTLGAVIGLADTQSDRRQLLDLAIAGPLAGLMLTLPIAWIGLAALPPPDPLPSRGIVLRAPLLLQWMLQWQQPEWATQPGFPLEKINPWLMAAWVGLWITGLNLLPIGQLDGGHIAYGLLGPRAHWVARIVLLTAISYILIAERYEWVLMVVLICLLGVDHPPTARDEICLDAKRRLVGWVTVLLPIFCFTPHPILIL
ncbi:MAG: site-2 protease family protein [Thermoguttaceae bacterium]|nr:site-2 protease family protein [Thermoguttaceae bacterium]MDW8037678.1 site-2 protease family protein [Thermoguttaceae bacterium]